MYKISVIVPVLNEEKNLKALFSCLSSQKGVLLDIVIADAGSKDKSKRIARSNGAKVVKGGLPNRGRNMGCAASKYENVVFFDADVKFGPTFIMDCLAEMEEKGLGVASVLTIPESHDLRDCLLFSFWNFGVWATQKFYPHAPGYCIFSKKSIHDKIQGFDDELHLGDDSNYVLRASKVAKFGVLHKKISTSVRRLHTEGRMKLAIKMLICAIYRPLFGEDRKNRFNYNFGKHK